jgi:hypothetical protein
MEQWRNHWAVARQHGVFYAVHAKATQQTASHEGSSLFAVYKTKPDKENIRGLNLVVVKLTTIQVTKLQL